jgi:hypothetical protein
MKKIKTEKMQSINGGSGCGWVGMGAAAAFMVAPFTGVIFHFTGLGDAVASCWNN